MADSWNTSEDKDKDQGKGINLLPEDLRRRESSLLKHTGSADPELRIPKREVLEKHEGKVPWFSWFSWFKREKKASEKAVETSEVKTKKPRLIFRILKDRRREQQELEQAKEEILKKTIIEDVLQKPAVNLPSNDNDLVNAAQRGKIGGTSTVALPDIYDQSTIKIERPSAPIPSTPVIPEPPVSEPLPIAPADLTPPAPESVLSQPNIVTPPEAPKPDGEHKSHQPFHWPMSFNHKDNGRGFAVNLIPTSFRMRNWQQVTMIAIWSFLGALIISAALYGGLWWWGDRLQNQRSALDDQIATVQQRIARFEVLRDDLAQTETTIKDMQMLINQHVYWTNFFAALERFTLADVYFDGVTAGLNGVMSFSAHAPDYLTAAKQVKLLQQPEALSFVLSASVNQMSGSNESGVNFTIDLVINPLLYYKTSNANQ